MNNIAVKLADRDLSGTLALVIDSDPTSRSVLINQLRDFGVGEVAHFGRVRDARKFLEIKKADFVLCEQDFADNTEYSGQDLLDDLRRAQLLPYSSVFIMVTGAATYSKVMEAAESSLDSYLLKPHKPSALYERLMQARRRKIYLKPIFDPLDVEDYARAAKVCELFFQKKVAYHVFAARLGADLLLRLGQHEPARKLFEEVVLEKDLPWAKVGVARALLDGGKVAPAIAKLDALIAEDRGYADAYDVIGRAYVESGQYAAAVEAYRKATELTPGSISRVQKYGTLSFYMGDYKTAYRTLSKCAILGADSKMFDYQSCVLLALCCLHAKDRKVLTRCYDDLAKAAQRQPDSMRLQRFKATVALVVKLMAGPSDEAVTMLRALAAELSAREFDFEAACNLSLVTAQTVAMGQILPEADAWIKAIGLRYCRSRSLTEQLGNTLQRHPPFQEVIKACSAEISAMAANSMSLSLAGDPKGAIERLCEQGQVTLNAKLIDNAYMVLQRYVNTLENPEVLREKVMALKSTLGSHQARDLIGRDTVRRAGAATLKAMAKPEMADGNETGAAFAD